MVRRAGGELQREHPVPADEEHQREELEVRPGVGHRDDVLQRLGLG